MINKKAQKKLRYYAYFRKSTESDERQVQSIPDQKEWSENVINEQGLIVKHSFQESMSARKTGRPVFNDMLARIENGEADSLIVYDPSRLARNAIDGARIIELLDKGKLRHLIFATYAFENTSMGKFMLGFFFAQSKLYTDNLSEVVKRGMRSKASKGMFPGRAKLGYFNHPVTKEILPDPKKFHHISTLFKLYATNRYSLNELSKEMHKRGLTSYTGLQIFTSSVANIISDPFYYGVFEWGGETYQGTHKPAITKKLWDDVQKIRQLRTRPVSKWSYDKVFNGLFRCKECGCSITSEEHTKHMKSGKTHHWIYYRCTKKRGIPCSQGFIREENLIEQIKEKTLSIALSDDIGMKMLGQIERWEIEEESRVSENSISLRKDAENIEAKLRRLNDLLVDGEINREEYSSRKKLLLDEKVSVENRLKVISGGGVMYWLEPLREFVNAVCKRSLETAGDDLVKLRDFVAEGGSNHCVESRKVLWDWNLPFSLLAERGVCTEWWAVLDSNR
ncbi:recombinase family protein [bacterium]|nr:recombinase family protein [bacterium]MBU1025477.1 recombinase family protein [bacterium]